ncbi:hypothetical protein BDV3_006678 [Batrachochytrium dendrobatidis]|uniref:NADH:ubiquinone oxidoreductase intermediate-associated protein 30 domain-containing protein n=1 Tax=Batrachochytrium dendrobatidis (strain JEL423) TaxID=403673 RepID=A0A177WR23_BATDL|nr:hypothetical protein O5D80_008572 [Batrachochytrium dendrobatidis]KAK5665617.1 hypothetical protein QVD99_007266 [Batrachochytrium dendrobatidis]OAJ42543.1 hypothetical protein BDEG_25992 [Batrachochytrium dendrobatidis JEL423]
MLALSATIFLASISVVSSQAVCKPDLLVDDFVKAQSAMVDGEVRPVNLLGGDYGAVGIEWSVDTAKKAAVLTSTNSSNFWFAKFDAIACFDLTGYSAITFDLVAPTGSDMSFTLTQKSANCVDRLIDSSYMPLTKYIKPNGSKQHVSLPLSDFAMNINGAPYDFKHLKDWTPTSLSPVGATFEISNLVLKGGCGNETSTATAAATTASAPSTVAATATASSAATATAAGGASSGTASGSGSTVKSSASSIVSSIFGSIMAAVAGLALF